MFFLRAKSIRVSSALREKRGMMGKHMGHVMQATVNCESVNSAEQPFQPICLFSRFLLHYLLMDMTSFCIGEFKDQSIFLPN